MTRLYLFWACLFVSLAGMAQSLPANTCGIVYAYDAAGNRTQRQYLCNNDVPGTNYVPLDARAKALDKDPAVQQVATLYPNPTTGRFTLSFTKPLDKALVTIVDAAGRTVQQGHYSGRTVEFDLSKVAGGLYVLQILDGSNVITQKVVKSK